MLTTIAGTYENGQVLFQETIPNYGKCDVFVTFLPATKQTNTKPNKFLFGKGPLYDATKTTLEEKLGALDYLSGLCKNSKITDDEIKDGRLERFLGKLCRFSDETKHLI